MEGVKCPTRQSTWTIAFQNSNVDSFYFTARFHIYVEYFQNVSHLTMSMALEDDADPTYTHFAHRSEFLHQLNRFIKLDLTRDPDQFEDEDEERSVARLGSIVSAISPASFTFTMRRSRAARLLPASPRSTRPFVARDRTPFDGCVALVPSSPRRH